eukprot:1085224-Pleurochrysis_carterae.AAC.1
MEQSRARWERSCAKGSGVDRDCSGVELDRNEVGMMEPSGARSELRGLEAAKWCLIGVEE